MKKKGCNNSQLRINKEYSVEVKFSMCITVTLPFLSLTYSPGVYINKYLFIKSNLHKITKTCWICLLAVMKIYITVGIFLWGIKTPTFIIYIFCHISSMMMSWHLWNILMFEYIFPKVVVSILHLFATTFCHNICHNILPQPQITRDYLMPI